MRVVAPTRPPQAGAQARRPRREPPSSIGTRRQLERLFQLATGGTADVHLGALAGAGGIQRPVAVKRIRSGVPREDEFRAALSGEALIGCFVRHANVVPVLGLVETQDDVLLVMEYVMGETLAQLQRGGQVLPVPVATAIMADVLRGLHAAHTARDHQGESLNIVHRDVSPQNVLVGIDGSARVIDFGMARWNTTNTSLFELEPTEAGYVKGKPGYLAPEQVTRAPLDARADIFAAGVVLWESLTGRRLFDGEDPIFRVLRFVSGPIPTASQYNQGVPAELDAILARALEPLAKDRFESAQEFVEKLEAVIRPASPSTVARFVQSHAQPSLALQRALVSKIQGQKELNNMSRTQRSVRSMLSSLERFEASQPESEEEESDLRQKSSYRVPLVTDHEAEDPTQIYLGSGSRSYDAFEQRLLSAEGSREPRTGVARRDAEFTQEVPRVPSRRPALFDSDIPLEAGEDVKRGSLEGKAVASRPDGDSVEKASRGTNATKGWVGRMRGTRLEPVVIVCVTLIAVAGLARITMSRSHDAKASVLAPAVPSRVEGLRAAEGPAGARQIDEKEPSVATREGSAATEQGRDAGSSKPARAKKRLSAAARRAACDPPYYFDRDYIKRMKRACL